MRARLGFVAAAVLASATCFADDVKKGDAAPDATFTTADGKALKLADYRGKKPVVLLFMRGFTGEFACYFCTGQTKAYKDEYAKLSAADVEVVMVLPGSKDSKGYLEKIGESDDDHPDPKFSVPYPVVGDLDFSACKAFGVKWVEPKPGQFPVSEPATIVIDKEGKVLFAHHGKNPEDRPPVAKVLEALGVKVEAKPEKTPAADAPRPTLAWVGYEEGMKAASAEKKPVLLEFYADW